MHKIAPRPHLTLAASSKLRKDSLTVSIAAAGTAAPEEEDRSSTAALALPLHLRTDSELSGNSSPGTPRTRRRGSSILRRASNDSEASPSPSAQRKRGVSFGRDVSVDDAPAVPRIVKLQRMASSTSSAGGSSDSASDSDDDDGNSPRSGIQYQRRSSRRASLQPALGSIHENKQGSGRSLSSNSSSRGLTRSGSTASNASFSLAPDSMDIFLKRRREQAEREKAFEKKVCRLAAGALLVVLVITGIAVGVTLGTKDSR